MIPHKDFQAFIERTRGYAPALLEHEGYYRLISPPQLKGLIREVLRKRHTPAKAREAESFLHSLVLTAIALGHPEAKDLATMAIMTHQIEFPRQGEEAE